MDTTPHLALVVAGVAGSGKTTVGKTIADLLGWEFLDGDALHPPENIARMTAGEPLTDHHRLPWLLRVRGLLENAVSSGAPIVLTCSALRNEYRTVLLENLPGVALAFLMCDEKTTRERLARRTGHFFPVALLDSQFAILETPPDDQCFEALSSPDEIAWSVIDRFRLRPHSNPR